MALALWPGAALGSDASADRVMLLPTAEVHPEGAVEIAAIELLLLQATAVIGDGVQVTVSGFPPVLEDQPSLADLTLKLAIARGERVRAALIGSAFVAHYDGSFAVGGRAGAVVDLCLLDACAQRFSASVHTAVSNKAVEAVPIAAGLGWTGRLSEMFALLVEVEGGSAVGAGKSGVRASDTVVVGYGARLVLGPAAIDGGFLLPITGFDTPLVLGVPFLAASLRLN